MVTNIEPAEHSRDACPQAGPRRAKFMKGHIVFDDGEFALRLLLRVGRLSSLGFTGLGVIFYYPPMRLPVVPLGNPRRLTYRLPVVMDEIATVLAELSDVSSPFHDGFHLVNCESRELTHVAQFVAPPLPSDAEKAAREWPVGARHMTALLVSRLKSVAMVGLLSDTEATVYTDGSVCREVPRSHE